MQLPLKRTARRLLAALGGLVLVACNGGGAANGPSPDRGPPGGGRGLVLVTVDGLVAAETSAFGGTVATPRLARMVAEGRAWTGWTASPLTRPAVATCLTGRAPAEHGVWNDVYTSLRPETTTLAGLLAAAGYRTAAFPDSSHLGYASGLLGGFAVVDDPAPAPTSVLRWLPALSDPAEQAGNFSAWLDGVAAGESFFAWLHTSAPLMRRFAPLGDEPAADLAAFDAWLGRVLDAALARGATVLLAGTFGNVWGAEGVLPGPGLSVAESAIAVPVVVTGLDVSAWRAAGELASSADVAATVAALAGLSLGGAGVPLAAAAPADRVVLSWSRAPRDELGWLPVGAARQAQTTVRVGAAAAAETAGAAALVAQLEQTLARSAPPPPGFAAVEAIGAVLERSGLTPRPAPAGGRAVLDATTRRAVAAAVWNARVALYRREWQAAARELERALDADPEALTPLLDRGQLLEWMGQADAGHRLVARATERYPGDVEAVHWYAHTLWAERRELAEPLLVALLPERPQDPDLLYDLACARTLAGDLDAAEARLRDAIAAGYRDWEHMEADPDLRALRESGRFAALMRDFRQ